MAGEIICGFLDITQHHKGEYMKKLILVLLISTLLALNAYAVDWSQYESGRNNINLQGYKTQPGYIEFQDGSGNITGYLWMGYDGSIPVLRYCSADAIDLTTTKLSDVVGVIVGAGY